VLLSYKMKKRDLIVLTAIPLIIFLSVFLFNLRINYFTSLLLVFGIPSLYLSLKNKEKIRKVGFFSILMGIPIAIIFELLAAFGDKAWIVPNSILPYRLFGFMPLEDLLWMFFVIYIILIFYEHFCNEKFQREISVRIRIMNFTLYSITFAIVLIFCFKPSLLIVPYSYLLAGIILFILPSTLFLLRYSSFIWSFFKVSLFFFYIHLAFELIGLKLNHWIFTGNHFIGWVSMLGLRFPIEELLFVMVLGGFVCCTYYEFFTNKKL